MDSENITIGEFKAWLTGLIVGKRGELPDVDDWREIKKMLDKVKEKEEAKVTFTPQTQSSGNITIYPNYIHEWKPQINPWDNGGIWYADFQQTTCYNGDIRNEASVPEQLNLELKPDPDLLLNWNHNQVEEVSQEELDKESKALGEALQQMIDDIEHAKA